MAWKVPKYFQTDEYVKSKHYLLSASSPDVFSSTIPKKSSLRSSASQALLGSPLYKKFVPLEQDLYKNGDGSYQNLTPYLHSGRLLSPSRYARGILGQSIDQAIHSHKLTMHGKDDEMKRKWLYDRPQYKLSFKDRLPPVDYKNYDMLQEYLELIHIDTTPKDYVTYAIHNIDLMLDYAVIKIMADRSKCLSLVQIF